MTGFTPNRFYPYAQPTDPADVPVYLRNFADAVDTDLKALEDISRPRPMAQFFGSVTNTVPGTSTSGTLTWQTTDFNTRTSTGTYAVQPFTDPATTQLTVNHTGFWWIAAAVQLQTTVSGGGIDLMGFDVLINGALSPPNTRTSTHDTVFLADTTHVLDLAAGVFLNQGDRVALRGFVGRSSLTNPVRFENRSITLMRMTQS